MPAIRGKTGLPARDTAPVRINVGCGSKPTPGWLNFDNSVSLKLAEWPLLEKTLCRLGLLNSAQRHMITACKWSGIRFANVTSHIPLPNGSVDVLYSSHMLEHLDRNGAGQFLAEARRVLKSGGIIRLSLPDLRKQIDAYLVHGDADVFISDMRLCVPAPRGVKDIVYQTVIGPRHHQWMYDAASLCRLLERNGFIDVVNLSPGQSHIPDPEPLNLYERSEESIYVEARRP